LPQRTAPWPAHRPAGPHPRSAIHDAALGAFGSFCTQAPAFLEAQRRRHPTQGPHNAQPWLGVEPRPCDKQGRLLREPSAPSPRDAVGREVLAGLAPPRMVAHFRCLGAQRLVAVDGPHAFSSTGMPGHNCRTRPRTKGQPLSDPAAITPVLVCPARSLGMACPLEYLRPQDGHAPQHGARAAGQRGLSTQAAQGAARGAP